MNRDQYEQELKKKQEEHIKRVLDNREVHEAAWRPCLHDGCPDCVGTGMKLDGSTCVHMISCPCPKCTPRF